eukprot:185532-Karenia_brevis.AAC.1
MYDIDGDHDDDDDDAADDDDYDDDYDDDHHHLHHHLSACRPCRHRALHKLRIALSVMVNSLRSQGS